MFFVEAQSVGLLMDLRDLLGREIDVVTEYVHRRNNSDENG